MIRGDIARRRHCWTVVAVAPLSIMYNYFNIMYIGTSI
jgi:hypothetical protein